MSLAAVNPDAWSAERCTQLLEKVSRCGDGWKARCPAHEDKEPSLWMCDGDSGGLVLLCYAGCAYKDIAAALEGMGATLPHSRAARDEIPDSHPALGRAHVYWDYTDKYGQIVMRVCRWDKPEGKDVRPVVRTREGWRWQHHENPRPLYRLHELLNDSERPVLVVEGEKAANAAQRLFPAWAVTTWAGGASSVGKADWSPLKGRVVTLVPDNDDPGIKAMEWVAQHLRGLAGSCRLVHPAEKAEGLAKGWDFADALSEGRDVSEWLAAEKRARIIRRISEIFAAPSRPRWLIRDVLEEGVIALLAGPRGSYKSFIAAHWAMTIASDGAACLIVSAEGAGLDRRLRAWIKKHGGKDEDIPVYAIERRIDFNSDEATLAVLKEIDAEELKPALIVIDTLSKNSGALDENSNSEVKAFIGRLDTLLKRRYGATVLLVHHTGHAEQGRARGASALEADTDALYIVKRNAGERVVQVSRDRFKDSPEQPPLAYRAEVIDLGERDDEGLPVSSLALEPVNVETIRSEQRGSVPRGLRQRDLLRVLRERQTQRDAKEGRHVALVWSSMELRQLARDIGMPKQTAQDAASAIAAFYMTPTVGGYRLQGKEDK